MANELRERIIKAYAAHGSVFSSNLITALEDLCKEYASEARREGAEQMREAAAGVVEKHDEGHQIGSSERYLFPRSSPTVSGLGYAKAIRALPLPSAPGLPCGHCNGSGREPGQKVSNLVSCAKCNGTGKSAPGGAKGEMS